MKELALNYKAIDEEIYFLTGNLIHAPSKKLLNNNSFLYIENKSLHVCFFDDISVDSLDNAFQQLIKEKSNFDNLKLFFSSTRLFLITLALIFAFVIAFGIFSAYGNAAFDLIEIFFGTSEITSKTTNKIWIFLLLLVLAMSLFPLAFKGEVQEYISHYIGRHHNDAFYRNRFKKYLKLFHKKHSINKIILWNPANKGFDGEDFWNTFVKSCLSLGDFKTYFCIHTDEKYKIELIIDDIYSNIEYDISDFDDQSINFLDQSEIPKEYLNKTEIQLLEVMIFCSTKNIPIIKKEIGIEGYSSSGNVISLSFVEYLVRNLPERLPDLNTFIDGVPLLVFFRRCTNDYGLTFNYNKTDLKLVGISENSDLMIGIAKEIKDELAFIYNYCSENSPQIIKEVTDPVAILILNILFLEKTIYSKSRIKLIESFISSIDEYEHYFLLRNYWPVIFCEECINNVNPYVLINVKAIIKISICFERAGLYESASNVHNLLKTLYPFQSLVSLARLDERKGNDMYSEGIKKLNLIWNEFDFKLDSLPLNDKLRYLLTYSWIVVSGRLNDEKINGKANLEKAKKLIASSHEIKNTNDQLWHFHNSEANYHEWDKEYDLAIREHEKCLKIPGLSQKWLSGTLVNLGIANRLLFCKPWNVSYIDESISYGQSGVDLKEEMGDNDELPIALHNLSLSMLFKFIILKETEEYNLISSNEYSDKALSIYEETGSQKKMVMALFEYFISSIIIRNSSKEKQLNFNTISSRGAQLINCINNNEYDDAHYKDMKILLESAFSIDISDKNNFVAWINENCSS